MQREPIRGAHRAIMLAAAVATGCLTACAPTELRPVGSSYTGAKLARPDVVLVRDFAVTPGEVQLDRGISARLIGAMGGASASTQEVAVARQVVGAISTALAAEINKLGLPAQTSGAAVEPAWQKRLIIEGQIVSIDEGNRTRRTMIGLGAGHSEVDADTQALYELKGTPPRLVESFEAVAKSGRKPGLAEGMGAGMAMDRVATSAAVSAGAAAASRSPAPPSRTTAAAWQGDRQKAGAVLRAQGWNPVRSA